MVCMTSLGLLLLEVTIERFKLPTLAPQPARTGVHGLAKYFNDKMRQIWICIVHYCVFVNKIEPTGICSQILVINFTDLIQF